MKTLTALNARISALALCLTSLALAAPVVTVPVGGTPLYLAVNPTTNVIYVSNLTGNNVSVIDGETNSVVATVPVGMAPAHIDVNTANGMVYVANLEGNSVSVIDGSTNTVTATITGLSSPLGLAVNSTTNQVFVSNNDTNDVAVIDGATNTIITTVPVENSPMGVSINSKANLIYVANNGSGTISVISGASDTVANTFALPQSAAPGNLAVDPKMNRLFITDGTNDAVYVLGASSGILLKTITGGGLPFDPVYAAILQPGKTVLISDYSRNVVMEVNETTYDTSGELRGGDGDDPAGIAVNQKTGKVYVAEGAGNTVIVYTE